ncbi:ABC transporter permease [Cryptosporangium aurantiacum]|nr:ABC transporter permease [Cryptosporangium aurantiacum]
MRLAIGILRQHRGSYVGTFLAAVLATALLAGAGLLLSSVLTAKPPANRFAAAPIVVSGDREVSLTTTTRKEKEGKPDKVKTKTKTERLTGAGTLPADLRQRLAALPGVSKTIGDTAFPMVLSTEAGRPVRGAQDAPVIGHGWSSAALTPFTLREGRAPSTGDVVVDANLAAAGELSIGSTVRVTTRTGERTLRVVGIAAPSGRDSLAAQGAVFVADREVAAIAGTDLPTAIGIVPSPGADVLEAVRDAAGDAPVLTGDDRVRADLPGAMPDYIGPISIFGFTIGITAFAAVFVLTGTVALSVRQRLRELALLRTVGATPGQLRRLLGRESVVLGLIAAVPALPLGVVVAHVVAARFRTLDAVPAQFTVTTNVVVLLAAAAAGTLVTFVAARVASRRAVRIAPTQALSETAATPRGGNAVRGVLAVITAAGGVAVLTFVPLGGPFGMGMSFVSSALLLCAVAALGPLVVRPLTAVFGRLATLGGVTGRLAGTVTRVESRRVAAVAVPLALMFAINAPMLLNSSLLARITADEQRARFAAADAQVTAPTGLPLATAEALSRLSGVTGTAATVPTRVIVAKGGKPEDYVAQGLLTTGRDSVLDLDVRDGALAGDGTFAASRYLTELSGWHVGEDVELWLADGHQVTLRLAAVYERARGFGDLALPATLVAAHDPRGLVSTVSLRYSGEVPEQIRAQWPTLRITPSLDAARAADAQNQQGAWELMVVISLGFTAIAVVNTFAIAATARRREYTDLWLAGATTGQVQGMTAREAAITVGIGLCLGAAVTTIVVGAFSTAQDGIFRLVPDVSIYLGLLGGIAALGLAAGTLPTRLVLRTRTR